MTYDELQGLTYLQVKGTGLANTCPVVETGEAGSKIPAKDYKLEKVRVGAFPNPADFLRTLFDLSLIHI